jgi:DNA mismatch repair ATPase MutS
MKLTKALKAKNSLIAEIQTLKEIIKDNNVILKQNTRQYNIEETFAKLLKKVSDLAKLKRDISVANNGIYENIFLLAEYKGLIEFLKTVDTTTGLSIKDDFRQVVAFEYEASIKDVNKKVLIEELVKSIEKIQDEVDEYNITKEI